MFAQSVAALCRLWSSNASDDRAFYSVIVNPNGNFSVKDDVFLSVPVRFQNGSYQIANDVRLQSFVEDMVNVSHGVLINFRKLLIFERVDLGHN